MSKDEMNDDSELRAEVEQALDDFDQLDDRSEPSADSLPDDRAHNDRPAPEAGDGTLDSSTIESDLDTYDHYNVASATTVGKEGDDDYDGRLQAVNEGRHTSDGRLPAREAEWDKERITQSLCSQLDLNESQQEGVLRAMKQLNLNKFGRQGRIETVALALITHVVNKDRLDYSSQATWINHEDRFREIRDSLDISVSDLSTAKRIALEQLSNIESGKSTPNRDPNLPEQSPYDRPDEWWEHTLARQSEMDDEIWDLTPDEFIRAIPERYHHYVPEQRLDEAL